MSRLTNAVVRLARRAGVEVRRRTSPDRMRDLGAGIALINDNPDPAVLQKRVGHHLAAEQVAWVLRALDINCVIDGGANRGQFAQSIRRSGYQGRIASFEPLPEFVEDLRRQAAQDHDWQVFPFALGDEDGEAVINVVEGTMSSMLPTSEFGRSWNRRLRSSHPETIQIRRLESVYADTVAGLDAPRVFLKLDTQGYDLLAFRGAGQHLGNVLGLMSEVSCVPIYDGMPRLTEQIAEYEAHGLEISGMYPVTIHRKSLRIIEFDVVMVRPDAVVSP